MYEFLEKICQSGQTPDLSAFNEVFTAAEMGRIKETVDDKTFANDLDEVRACIKILNEHKPNTGEEDILAVQRELQAKFKGEGIK